MINYAVGTGPGQIDNFSNFIKIPSTIYDNLEIDKNGYVEIPYFDMRAY